MAESGTAHEHEGHAQHQHHHQENEEHIEQNQKKAGKLAWLKTPLGIFFLVMTISIVILTVFFRIPMLKFFGFYEPDGFYHYSVIRDAVQHGFIIQHYLPTSGWPSPTPVTEPYGLYWVTLIPYFFLRFFGVSYYTVERLIPLLFGVLDVLGAYLLSRYISKDKFFGLLVMALVALSGGDEARTSALIYRGDGFAAIFLILALVCVLEIFRNSSRKRKILMAVLSGISLSFCSLVFSGAAFALGTYAIAFFLILALAFIFAKPELIENLKYALLGVFVWWILSSLYLSQGWIQPQLFVGLQFLYMFVPMLAGWVITYLLINKADLVSRTVDVKSLLGTPLIRTLFLGVLAVVLIVILVVGASGFLYNIFVNNGFVTAANSHSAINGTTFESTIQELQPPTPGFLFASFVVTLYAAPPALMVLFSAWVGNYLNLIFILLIVSFAPYLFMQVYDSGGFLSGRTRLMFDINLGMLALIAYFIVTAYLQVHAIRFNSLVSVPLAILSAFGIYWLIGYARTNKEGSPKLAFAAAGLFAFIIMLSIWIQLPTILGYSISSSFLLNAVSVLLAVIVGVLVALKYLYPDKSKMAILDIGIIIVALIYAALQAPSFAQYPTVEVASVLMILSMVAIAVAEYKYDVSAWYAFGMVFFIFILVYYNAIYTAGLVQADSLDPAFFSALQWFGANSPQNASVLTLWPDGSVVEGIANRSTITDSVGSQNATEADAFAAWLLNSSTDPGFMTSIYAHGPGYLIVRHTWMSETGGIYTEATVANPNLVSSNYSYIQFTSFTENVNSTVAELQFTAQPSSSTELVAYVYVEKNTSSSSAPLQSSIVVYNTSTGRSVGTIALSEVTFYNDSDAAFSQVPVSNASVESAYMLLLNYSAVPRPGASINITGAYAIAPGLANSNMFKALFLCNTAICELDSSAVQYQVAYQNTDTKIIKMTYNTSS